MSVQCSVVDDDQKRGLATTTEGKKASAIAISRDFAGRPACTVRPFAPSQQLPFFFSGLGTHSSSDFAARAQTSRAASAGAPQAQQMHPVKATVSDPASSASSPAQPAAAPGTEIYTARRGEAIPTIARRYLGRTSYLTAQCRHLYFLE
jgi:hypothetical protein